MSETPEEQFLRVGAGSNPQSVASAIAHAIYENGTCKLRAVGAGAVNQAVKAIAIASGYTAPRGISLSCIPGFASVDSNGDTISAIVFKVNSVS
ncbi:SpoVS Stage V sporulation protein SpoVS [uncultured Caudovirales phage]|uniref:SpoVS Stage V sporulation protein SpoVS n=1 Tax=uncultured Caudovirales phage TaxID=2100421 RepID=A0A6J7WNM9_9CAUD|nr:SpoVS Stage V sporulation protein SpoVS [uncultured Caudovirales phage]CAB5219639.1 SpoVS Stage V sporulation protein SpoVS [uncultured Caudovirales phage]